MRPGPTEVMYDFDNVKCLLNKGRPIFLFAAQIVDRFKGNMFMLSAEVSNGYVCYDGSLLLTTSCYISKNDGNQNEKCISLIAL